MSELLTETVSESLLRDLRRIKVKIVHVLMPICGQGLNQQQLREWDLWGPLLLCLLLAATLSLRTSESLQLLFSVVFVMVWLGSFIVTLNARLLGIRLSLFATVCILGYCLCPINLAVLLYMIAAPFIGSVGKLTLVAVGFIWSSYSSSGFLRELVSEDRRRLVLYPVLLFYAFLSWTALVV